MLGGSGRCRSRSSQRAAPTLGVVTASGHSGGQDAARRRGPGRGPSATALRCSPGAVPSRPSWGRSRPPHCASGAPVSSLGPEAPRGLASAPVSCHRSSGLSSDRSQPPQAFAPAVPWPGTLSPGAPRAGPLLPPSSRRRRHPRRASRGLVVSGSHAVSLKATVLCGLSCLVWPPFPGDTRRVPGMEAPRDRTLVACSPTARTRPSAGEWRRECASEQMSARPPGAPGQARASPQTRTSVHLGSHPACKRLCLPMY